MHNRTGSLIKLFTHSHIGRSHSLKLTINFLNLWKHCCRITHDSFHTI